LKKELDIGSFHTPFSDHTDHPVVVPQDGGAYKDESEHVEFGELKKLDSFGQWMDKEIGGDCDNSLMASDSGNYWNTLDADNKDTEVYSLRQMQLDVDSLGPSLSLEQLFSIHDFSPDWAYSGVRTKVCVYLFSFNTNSHTHTPHTTHTPEILNHDIKFVLIYFFLV
jgi:hypothetical protein